MSVLTADLRWVHADKVSQGDRLVGFDEFPPPGDGRSSRWRRWQAATVTHAGNITRPCYDLAFDDGSTARCAAGHRWLVGGSEGARWRSTDALWGGAHLIKPLDPWDELSTWEAGYLAAAFDGEGHLIQRDLSHAERGVYAFKVGFSQKPNAMLEQVEAILTAHGYAFTSKRAGGPDVRCLTIGKREQALRLLGSVRPRRLLAKVDPNCFGAMSLRTVRLVEARPAGDHEVVAISTDIGTHLADGFASHT